MKKRVGVFGWGIVAPKSPNVTVFRKNLATGKSWLTPFEGFGPNNFLVGEPDFNFNDYRNWIDARFAPRHFQNLKEKMDTPSLYAIGAFIQALDQNPGLNALLPQLGNETHVYIGTGLGAVDTFYQSSIALYEAQRHWNAFWALPAHNSVVTTYLATGSCEGTRGGSSEIPVDPELVLGLEKEIAIAKWNAFWMAVSPELQAYLAEAAEIDGLAVEGDVESGKLNVLRERSRRHARLQEKWQSPEPPWKVSANFIWNIHNTPASQVSILGKITGLVFAPVAACSTFGVALRLGMRAIETGDAKLVVIGATDPPPHALTVGSFYGARVLAANRRVSNPLTFLQGTHIAGGAAVWIIGDMEYLMDRGFHPLGMEPVSVGVSADAHHIITPSIDGPRASIQQALTEANAEVSEVGTWDLHATATPGDYAEMATLRSMLPDDVLVTARKGTFGHGMSAGSGWELTAQYMGFESGHLFPTPLRAEDLNEAIRTIHGSFVFSDPCPFPPGLAGKLSMGVGGINACVISRPLKI